MMLNAAKGARDERLTICFPPEEPPWGDRASDPAHDGLAEPPEPDDNAPRSEPDLPAGAGTPEAPAPLASPDVGAQGLISTAPQVTRYVWIREVPQPGDDGVIFRAQEAETGNLVTVELLSQTAARDAEQVRLFYLEAEAAARLRHPNIARFYRAEPFVLTHQRRASHLPGGETLRELLARGGWFDPARAVRVVTQVADALAYAHRAGVLHLNLQPEHIWLGGDDWVFITGFGIADVEELEWARRLRAGRCAPPYLSPEQLGGRAGDRASDLYALGVIFYELLTDRVPFDSNDLDQLRRRHRIKTPRPPHDFNHDLTPELSETVMALLHRDPEARLSSFNGAGGFQALVVQAEGRAPARPAFPPRMTNPMPLSELAAEVGASSPAGPTEDEPVRPLPALAPPPASPRHRSRDHYRSVLALIALVMLPWLVIIGIQKLMNRRGTDPQQQASLASQADPAPSATVELAQPPGPSNAPVAAPLPDGPASAASGEPAAAEPGDGILANDVIDAPPAALRATRRPTPSPPPAEEATGAGNLAFGTPIKRIGPVYPASARARRASGLVIVEVSVSERGNVTQARVVSGPDVFRASALTAARQWQFTPTTLNGVPVKVHRMITFRYDPLEARAVNPSRQRAQSQPQGVRRNGRGRLSNSSGMRGGRRY